MDDGSCIGYAAGVARAVVREPAEAVERVRERLAQRRQLEIDAPAYEVVSDHDERLHAALGLPWPCDAQVQFAAAWSQIVHGLAARTAPGERIGRGAFAGCDDGDPGLARMAWCLTRHLRPAVAVETGVARGLISATVLRAMTLNGMGRLWSIDLPPLSTSGLGEQVGIAVEDADRHRWTLRRGSSRRMLPPLVRELGHIDLFIHDSMHTDRNVFFELACVWPALSPGGPALVDDVNRSSRAFLTFAHRHAVTLSMICSADDRVAPFGLMLRTPLDRRLERPAVPRIAAG